MADLGAGGSAGRDGQTNAGPGAQHDAQPQPGKQHHQAHDRVAEEHHRVHERTATGSTRRATSTRNAAAVSNLVDRHVHPRHARRPHPKPGRQPLTRLEEHAGRRIIDLATLRRSSDPTRELRGPSRIRAPALTRSRRLMTVPTDRTRRASRACAACRSST